MAWPSYNISSSPSRLPNEVDWVTRDPAYPQAALEYIPPAFLMPDPTTLPTDPLYDPSAQHMPASPDSGSMTHLPKSNPDGMDHDTMNHPSVKRTSTTDLPERHQSGHSPLWTSASSTQAAGPSKANGSKSPNGKVSCGNRDKHRTNDALGPVKCGWSKCKYRGPFTRKGVLMRHIETQHVAPHAYECPNKRCGKLFNRKDNRDEHLRRVHWDVV